MKKSMLLLLFILTFGLCESKTKMLTIAYGAERCDYTNYENGKTHSSRDNYIMFINQLDTNIPLIVVSFFDLSGQSTQVLSFRVLSVESKSVNSGKIHAEVYYGIVELNGKEYAGECIIGSDAKTNAIDGVNFHIRENGERRSSISLFEFTNNPVVRISEH